MTNLTLNNIEFMIFDLDGVFYRDDTVIQGGKEIIEFLEKCHIGYCFLTNNSCYPLQKYQDKLKVCGIDVSTEKIINTTSLLTSYIKKRDYEDIYVLGSPHLQNALYGHFKYNDAKPDALVVGMHDKITLEDISKALSLVSDDSEIIAANPDKLIPKSDGFGLECGIIIDIIYNVTGKMPYVVGKPSEYAFDFILKKYKLQKENVLMVGDTYDTDILGAINAGIKAAWVNTGNALPKGIAKDQFVSLNSLNDLNRLINRPKG